MRYEQNKIHIMSPEYALILIEAPDTGKVLYNLIEYPKSEYHEENVFVTVISTYSYEDLMRKSLSLLCHILGKYNHLRRAIVDLADVCNKYDRTDWDNNVTIAKEFCVKEMKIPKDQLEEMGPWRWNLVMFSDGKYQLATE